MTMTNSIAHALHQAGIALENAFLQRKLQSLQDKG